MDVKVAFGKVLRKYREEAGLSQEKLAFECDLHRNFIGMLERGERQPTLETLFTISSVLEIDAAVIVKDVKLQLVNMDG